MTRHVSSSSYDVRVVRSRGMLDARRMTLSTTRHVSSSSYDKRAQVCFMQMDDTLYHKAVQKVADLCFGNLLYQQQAQLGVLLTAISPVDPKYVVEKIVPLCLRILLERDGDATPRTHRTPTSARSASRAAPAGGGGGGEGGYTWSAASAVLAAEAHGSKSPGGGVGSPGREMKDLKEKGVLRTPSWNSKSPASAGMGLLRLAPLSETELVYYLNILTQVAQVAADEMWRHKVCRYKDMFTYIHIHMHLHLHIHIHMYVYMYIYIYRTIHICMCICIYRTRYTRCWTAPCRLKSDPASSRVR